MAPAGSHPQAVWVFEEALQFVLEFLHGRFDHQTIRFVLDWLDGYIVSQANAGLVVDPVRDFPLELRNRVPIEVVEAVDLANLEYLRHLGLVADN